MDIISGIYCIRNIVNDKRYIGQSNNIYSRWDKHKSFLNNNNHHNRHLQASWNKYGSESFEFSIIEECSLDVIDERERYWIEELDTFNTGYNLDKGGNGIRGYKHTEEELNKMRVCQNPLIVLQFDMDFNLINRYVGGYTHASKSNNGTHECIKRRCEHTCKEMLPYKNSYWVYEDEFNHIDFTWEKYLNNIRILKPREKKIRYQKKICQYDLQGVYIKTWNTYKEIEDAGFVKNQISAICNQSYGKTCMGYIWAFEGYDFSDGYFDNIIKRNTPKSPKEKKYNYNKPVQCDLNGNVLCIYENSHEAAQAIGSNYYDVAHACKGRKNKKGLITHKLKGYIWRYA